MARSCTTDFVYSTRFDGEGIASTIVCRRFRQCVGCGWHAQSGGKRVAPVNPPCGLPRSCVLFSLATARRFSLFSWRAAVLVRVGPTSLYRRSLKHTVNFSKMHVETLLA